MAGVPSVATGDTPGVGSAYLRIWVLLLGITNEWSIDTLLMGRLMDKYSGCKKTH